MRIDVGAAVVAQALIDERVAFTRRTYFHLAGAVLTFCLLEALLLTWSGARGLAALMTGGYAWLIVLAAFGGVAYLADRWAHADTSPRTQYLGLGLYVVAEAVIFLPLMVVAARVTSPHVIPAAGLLTLLLFAGLSLFALTSGHDFSWLRGILVVGGCLAFGLIVASIVFGFTLGLAFAAVMVVYAAASILYETSSIMREYRSDQHVAAALALFASLGLLFWYVLRIAVEVAASGDD